MPPGAIFWGGWGRPPGVHHFPLAAVCCARRMAAAFALVVFRFRRLRFVLPRFWLHLRQMVRPLLSVLVPPFAHGMMWSGSALLGRRVWV